MNPPVVVFLLASVAAFGVMGAVLNGHSLEYEWAWPGLVGLYALYAALQEWVK